MSPSGLGLARTLPEHGLIAIIWGSIGLAGFLVAVRTAIRVKKTERLHRDDYFIYAAFLVLVINAILQTLQVPHSYDLVRFESGLSTITVEASVASGNIFLRYEFTIIGLFWTILWLVKGSFLAFFYKLFDGLPIYRRIWWGVVAFAFLSYCGCWILSINVCHPVSNYFIFGGCSKAIDKKTSTISVMYSTAVDVLTDLMIIALPLPLLWRVRISPSEKRGLAGVFSIGILIIVVAIARAIQIAFTSTSDPVLLALWGIIESTISVIVGCLPPFKSLFGGPKKTPFGPSYEERYSKNILTDELRNGSIPLESRAMQNTKIRGGQVKLTSESTEDIVGSSGEEDKWKMGNGGIFVSHDVHQTSC